MTRLTLACDKTRKCGLNPLYHKTWVISLLNRCAPNKVVAKGVLSQNQAHLHVHGNATIDERQKLCNYEIFNSTKNNCDLNITLGLLPATSASCSCFDVIVPTRLPPSTLTNEPIS